MSQIFQLCYRRLVKLSGCRVLRFAVIAMLVMLFPKFSDALASQNDDRFIEGYATAILERVLDVKVQSVQVEQGSLSIHIKNFGPSDSESIKAVLSSIEGVAKVEIIAEPDAADRGTQLQVEQNTQNKSGLFPRENLFAPLLAAPRWPHFSLAYHYYLGDEELSSVGSTSFGETFYFYKGRAPFDGMWQTGIQASVFAIFDLDSDSMDLVNADYWVGFPISYRCEDFSAILRVFHQSSHLGDEYLLRKRIDRVNLSYESVDVKFSYDFSKSLRLYSGGGFIFHKEPADIDPWSLQAGIELRSPTAYVHETVRPLLAADFSTWQENGWDIDVSVRCGVQLESKRINRKIQFLLEYFNGHSPSGQFYERIIEYLGFGTHFYF